ncbi:ATP-binding protein [Longimicrobium sp.]|uniref:sensor histidine kinase n=1 Tax=Longimicrobium sp. TaxID=2029185 RepID=UPI002B6B5703|nr:ATP-binding protein [Longimicrobium sp.]HSU14769.1 ATP-binding protein [Longimicrobium sp.]
MTRSDRPLRLSPRQRLAAVLTPALLVLAFDAATFWGTLRERGSRNVVDESHRTIEALQQVLATSSAAETAQQRYLLTGDESALVPFERARGEMGTLLARLHALTADDPEAAKARADTLERVITQRMDELRATAALARAGDRAGALQRVRSARVARLADEAARVADAVRGNEEAELSARGTREEGVTRRLVLLVVLGAAACAGVTLAVNALLGRYGASQEAFAGEMERLNARLAEQSAALQQLTAELQERTSAAEEANRAKSRFLAGMSHDLRTPLNAISGYTDLLETGIRGPVNDAQKADLQRIRASSRHLLSLIDTILSFARTESGKLEVRVEPVPAAGLVRGIESSFLPQLAEKGLHYECDPGPPGLWVMADPGKTERVLLNLIGNAIKFTDAGGRVAVRCEDEGDVVAIHARDTGRGIARDQLPHVFQPFVQVDREQVPEAKRGVGLGLAISRELAVAMGGTLTVESEVGRGSVFTLRLPRAPIPARAPARPRRPT